MDQYGYLLDLMPDLPANKRRQLMRLLYDRESDLRDIRRVVATKGYGVGSPTWTTAIEQKEAESAAKVAELCSPEYPDAARLVALAPAMSTVSVFFAPALDYSGVPLSAEQAMKLAEVVNELHFSPTADPGARDAGTSGIYRELVRRTSRFLSRTQVDALTGQQEIARANYELRQTAARP